MIDLARMDDDGKCGCWRSIVYSVVLFLFGSYSVAGPACITLPASNGNAEGVWRLINEHIDRHNDQRPATIKQNKVDAVPGVSLPLFAHAVVSRLDKTSLQRTASS